MQFTLPRSREDLYTHSINENRRGKKKEQKFSTHVYTYGTAKRVSMSALRRVLYVDWEFGYDFWQKSLPAWNWLKVLITAFTMARVRYLWQNCPCKEVTMQEYHTYLVPILHYIIFKNIRLKKFQQSVYLPQSSSFTQVLRNCFKYWKGLNVYNALNTVCTLNKIPVKFRTYWNQRLKNTMNEQKLYTE